MKRNNASTAYESLLGKIKAGELLPGTPLASENAMAADYGISRPTIRKALEMLESGGHIVKKPGIGAFVCVPQAASGKGGARRRLTFAVDTFGSEGNGSDFYYGLILRGMKRACEEHGCRLALAEKRELASAEKGAYDGAIVMRSNPEDNEGYAAIAESGTPVVMINRFPSQPSLAFLSVDYRKEAEKAVGFLLSDGCESVALIGYSECGVPGLRSEGWALAHAKSGVAARDSLRFPESSIRDGAGPLVDFLKRERPRAVFVPLGARIIQTVHALGQANLRIPEDVMILCADDMEETSDELGIPISYVKMPLHAMGRRAIEHLARRNDDPACAPVRSLFEASLAISGPRLHSNAMNRKEGMA